VVLWWWPQFEDWPEGEEVIGDFDYVYDANALIQERVNDVHDDDYTKELDERDLFHLGTPQTLHHLAPDRSASSSPFHSQ
jgi:hypothetical protein